MTARNLEDKIKATSGVKLMKIRIEVGTRGILLVKMTVHNSDYKNMPKLKANKVNTQIITVPYVKAHINSLRLKLIPWRTNLYSSAHDPDLINQQNKLAQNSSSHYLIRQLYTLNPSLLTETVREKEQTCSSDQTRCGRKQVWKVIGPTCKSRVHIVIIKVRDM